MSDQIAFIHVAVGVIKNAAGEVLISRRKDDVHQGGLWEFPGGKIEAGENVRQALARELHEELNIRVDAAMPLLQINHDYGDLRVLLDVWAVDVFSGSVRACENQPLQWVQPDSLDAYRFPAANEPIITAARLPRHYAILEGEDVGAVIRDLQKILAAGIKLLQVRLKNLPLLQRWDCLQAALPLCRSHGVRVMLNSSLANAANLAVDGIHLTARDLLRLQTRPPDYSWVAASCHNIEELVHAQRIGADFAVLAPVCTTASHPGVKPLGWQRFAECVAQVNIPVYALGGLTADSFSQASAAGAQGIAGIRLFAG